MDKQILNAISNLEKRVVDLYHKVKKLGEIPSVSGTQVTKVQKTTITTAQVLQLNATPITILNSDDPLTIKYPINIYIKRNSGNAYAVSGNFALVKDGNVGIALNTLNSTPMTSSQEGFMQSPISLSLISSGTTKNSIYKLTMFNAPTGGTGDLDVYVTYMEITL